MAKQQRHVSVWETTAVSEQRPPLLGEMSADVAVIGAGITGLTAALHLKRAGKRVVVLEAERVGAGTTGHTTGHLSTLWDGGYGTLRRAYGEDAVKLVHAALREGIEEIERAARDLAIECGFARVDGYLYAEAGQDEAAVERELEAALACGLPVAATADVALPFAVARALRIEGQGRLHALRYVQGLARAVDGDGSRVLEKSRVQSIDDGEPCRVTTRAGILRANDIVLATHTPLGVSALHTAVVPRRSYAMAIRTDAPVGEGLFWDVAEPYHYIRRHSMDGVDLLIVGGEDRKTAHGREIASFENLDDYASLRFDIREVVHAWSAQLYEPVDGLPFIGRAPRAAHVFVATGLSGDGLPFGSFAGRAIARLILGGPEPHDGLYRPSRVRWQGLRRWAEENLDVARSLVGDRIMPRTPESAQALAPGEGCVVGTPLSSKLAVFRDEQGELHRFDATCPHMGCLVRWNGAQKTFDCPCHGARFACDGSVLEGPALRGLARAEEPAEVAGRHGGSS